MVWLSLSLSVVGIGLAATYDRKGVRWSTYFVECLLVWGFAALGWWLPFVWFGWHGFVIVVPWLVTGCACLYRLENTERWGYSDVSTKLSRLPTHQQLREFKGR